ncbi:TRAP transporter small permease subunit [Rugosibacter aromaticivorans]|uniref:TRAP transporter small permease subunit n=1 Tax=Rugosibacter aromaticivorans TaxID=1565605 RepID=UPI000B156471|nr:TRAP transporter small permease subunit [Rugosibacter aromaticivorans]TBR13449.1 MAG: TRAP transporter small permease subunit [Rugosibacter sp.]
MQRLLYVSGLIDRLNQRIGNSILWLILVTVLISAGNALVRKVFQTSSNALLEVQWYLFSAVFLLGAGYALLKDAHVRIDFIASHLSRRSCHWIEIVGIVVFLLPLCFMLIDLSWPLVVNAWVSGEMSQNAGGLIRWPVYLLLPVGLALLLLQGISELIKRIAYLRDVLVELSEDNAANPGAGLAVNAAESEINAHALTASKEIR